MTENVPFSFGFLVFFRNASFFFLSFHYLSSSYAPTKTAPEPQFPFLLWSYPQVQKSSNPGVFYSSFQLHWLAAHLAFQLFRSWLNPCGTSWELHCQASSLEAKPSQGPVPKERNVPPCSPVPHPQSSRRHQSCLCLEAQCERSIKMDWITLNTNRIHTAAHTKKKLQVVYHHETMKWNILDQSSCSVKSLHIETFGVCFKNEILNSCLQILFNQLNRIK